MDSLLLGRSRMFPSARLSFFSAIRGSSMSMQTRANACCVLLFATACSVLVGCSSKDPEQTRVSRKAQMIAFRRLLKNIRTLEDENRQLKADSAARADALKKTYDAQASTVAAANRRSTADLEGKIADLQMELSMSEKQRLALQGVADQPKRLQALLAGEPKHGTAQFGFPSCSSRLWCRSGWRCDTTPYASSVVTTSFGWSLNYRD